MVLEPPCATFSLARRPALRNSDQPEGFNAEDFKTNEGNYFGLACCILCLSQWAWNSQLMGTCGLRIGGCLFFISVVIRLLLRGVDIFGLGPFT